MTRPLRIEYSSVVYHITSQGNNKKLSLRTNLGRETFLSILDRVNRRYREYIGKGGEIQEEKFAS